MQNITAVVVATIAYMIVGMLWYGPLFGKHWLKTMGLSEKDLKKKKKGLGRALTASFITGLVTAYVLSYAIGYFNVKSIGLAANIAFWIWLGFVAAVNLPNYFYEQKPLKLYAIHAAYQLVYLVIMAAILALWA